MKTADTSNLKFDPKWVERSLVGGVLGLLGAIAAWMAIGNLIR